MRPLLVGSARRPCLGHHGPSVQAGLLAGPIQEDPLRLVRLRLAGLAVLPVAAVLLAAPAATAASTGVGSADRVAVAPVPVYAGPSAGETYVGDETPAAATAGRRATFRVTYTGFPATAKASFQRAVDYWAGQVSSSVPITVKATYRNLGSPNVLGSAGPSFVWRNFTGAPARDTFYVDAIANKRAGNQLDASPDIVANFNSAFTNWHFGSTAAPGGKYDFQSVVTHELGHGLGFLGAGRIAGGKGSVQVGSPLDPISYDRFTESAGKALLSFPDNSTQLAAQITGNKLFFDSRPVRGANGGTPAKLYAPSRYAGGSSYSHLDEATYRAGNRNSLMSPQIGPGETIRSAGPITLAVFGSIGW